MKRFVLVLSGLLMFACGTLDDSGTGADGGKSGRDGGPSSAMCTGQKKTSSTRCSECTITGAVSGCDLTACTGTCSCTAHETTYSITHEPKLCSSCCTVCATGKACGDVCLPSGTSCPTTLSNYCACDD